MTGEGGGEGGDRTLEKEREEEPERVVAGARKSDEKEGVGLIAGSGGSATPLRLPGERGGSVNGVRENEGGGAGRVSERASEPGEEEA